MSGHVGNLSESQAACLAQFRQNVQDILKEHHDDYYLLRWLRARKFDLNKSEAMLRNHIKWRAVNNVDTILEDFEPPEVMQKYYTGGLFGQDKEGALLWIDPNGYIDMKGILMSMRKQDVIKSKIWLLEEIYRLFELKTKEQGRRVDQMVIIFDLEKFGLKHLWKPGVDVFTEIVATFEDHYPETLKKTFVINAPKIFPIAYNLLRPFLSEETHRKVTICGSNFREVLLHHIDPDQLPQHWGGTCVDPDGNPRCPSKINPGGEVPQSYYRQNDLTDLAGFTQVSIGRGSSLQLDYVIEKPGSAIRWQFKTDGFDIGFGIYLRTEDKRQKACDMDHVLPSQRVNSHMIPEDGMLQCRVAGTYIVRFDNTYSWARAKKLFYIIEILEPESYDMPKVDSSASLASRESFTTGIK
ncbi:SEC14-like protein 2 [Physella acuta]|uniref:SEC14-like protein 2 n=1 Tax=Physella acuta TaxID=109671 RepID=UPI0027DC8194|nr:SEC14-like protein 2 [Physella acuta]XP_059149157.1 SEC14-like protein 2 [Physella acuta]